MTESKPKAGSPRSRRFRVGTSIFFARIFRYRRIAAVFLDLDV